MGKTIGIVGCGFIGSKLGEYARKELIAHVSKIILCDEKSARAKTLAEKISGAVIAESIEELVQKSDLIVEAATGKIVPELLRMAIAGEKDILIMSIGGLLGNEDLLKQAEKKGIRLLLPSGAIAGIDALKSARLAGIESVTLTTRKPPKSLIGAPYLAEKGIDVSAVTKETVIFEGNAVEAMKGFPQNINVSAMLSLAGIGGDKTKVRIVVAPEYTKNIHEVEIVSKAGIIKTRTENVPSPDNPKTSYLAALAAAASLKEYFTTVRMGT